MYELRLSFWTLKADPGAARLEGFEIRAGGNFLVVVLARQPHLNVIGFRGRETDVPRGQHHGAKGQTQAAQNIFGVRGEFFKLLIALIRPRELHQLHFLKLVLPDDASHVAAIGARLAAKARGVRAQADGKPLCVQRLIAIEIGHRDFGRRRQPKIVFLAFEQIIGEFGELSGSEQAG